MGIYAVEGLHWPASRVGLLFLASAPAAAVANYLSGRVSDRIGRKPLIFWSFLASAANLALLAWLGGPTAVAFALIILQGVIGAPAFSLVGCALKTTRLAAAWLMVNPAEVAPVRAPEVAASV